MIETLGPGGAPPTARPTGRARTVVVSAIAGVIAFAALVAPPDLRDLSPLVLLRIPAEGLVGAGLILVSGTAARRGSRARAGRCSARCSWCGS
ncbi:hypothetical protein ACFQX7_39605 [Luedemannella flava]